MGIWRACECSVMPVPARYRLSLFRLRELRASSLYPEPRGYGAQRRYKGVKQDRGAYERAGDCDWVRRKLGGRNVRTA